MPSPGYTRFIKNGINIKKAMLSPTENSIFSKDSVLVNFNVRTSKNPGRNVSDTKPSTGLTTGISRMMDISVRAINASVEAQISFEWKATAMAPLRVKQTRP
jgi:hypothetical protein